jgi:hypothetical protein
MKKAEILSATFATLFVTTMIVAVAYNIIVHGVREF